MIAKNLGKPSSIKNEDQEETGAALRIEELARKLEEAKEVAQEESKGRTTMIRAELQEGTLMVRLPAEATIEEVERDLSRLKEVLRGDEHFHSVVVNCEEVRVTDTAYLQLLCSLSRTALARGKRIRYEEVMPPLVEIAALYGIYQDRGEKW